VCHTNVAILSEQQRGGKGNVQNIIISKCHKSDLKYLVAESKQKLILNRFNQ